MKQRSIVLKTLIIGFLSILLSGNKAQAGDDLPVLHFQKIHDAIVNGDASTFASLVKYPILRDYPLKNIEDSAQMVALFPVLIDDSLRNAYHDVKPTDWEGGGWRGYTDGNFWDDGTGIYSIEYYSKAELKTKADLEKKEIASLHPSLQREDIVPFACLYDESSHVVLRVDRIVGDDENSDNYRVCIYRDMAKLTDKPDVILEATLDVDGSEGMQWFTCYLKKGKRRSHYMDFTLDYTDSPDGLDAKVFTGKFKGTHKLHSAYWLDLLKL